MPRSGLDPPVDSREGLRRISHYFLSERGEGPPQAVLLPVCCADTEEYGVARRLRLALRAQGVDVIELAVSRRREDGPAPADDDGRLVLPMTRADDWYDEAAVGRRLEQVFGERGKIPHCCLLPVPRLSAGLLHYCACALFVLLPGADALRRTYVRIKAVSRPEDLAIACLTEHKNQRRQYAEKLVEGGARFLGISLRIVELENDMGEAPGRIALTAFNHFLRLAREARMEAGKGREGGPYNNSKRGPYELDHRLNRERNAGYIEKTGHGNPAGTDRRPPFTG